MAVFFSQLCNLWCVNRGQSVFVCFIVHANHRTHAVKGGRLFADFAAVFRQDCDITIQSREFTGAAEAAGGTRIQTIAIMFGDNQDSVHPARPFCFSSATSSAASATILPFWRAGGASVFTTVTRVSGVIPNSSSSIVVSGLRFAFMISGIFT